MKKNRSDKYEENETMAEMNANLDAQEGKKAGKKGKKKHRGLKILLALVSIALALYFIGFITNIFINLSLRSYIKSFEAVEYSSDRLVPQVEDGYYCIKTDRDVNIMHITDVHIGGGFWSYKNDKKTIYELITMLQTEKPDFVILGGDNTYCVPGLGFNGGFTANNRMAARTLIEIFEHEKVYFTTVFGNHDTESFNYADRDEIGALYMDDKFEYCFFEQQFSDRDATTVPSVSNQFVLIKNTKGEITKLVLLLDTNAYVDTKFMSTVFGKYDVIHPAQTKWVKETIEELSKEAGLPEGEYLKCLVFMHIPFGEYRNALDDLIVEERDKKGNIVSFAQKKPQNTEFVEGVWGEEKVCYGGLSNEGSPESQDNFFEVIADEMHSMEAAFSGHDHTNNAVVYYKGVMLSYGYSVDNEAYGNEISESGTQRGATVITVSPDGSFKQVHKNAYTDYGCSTTMFKDIYLDRPLYPEFFRTVE